MQRGAQMGLAVAVGYLLGRRRKLRKALMLAGAVAVGRMSTDPSQLVRRGTEALRASPQFAGLGKPLAAAGKAAATAAAGSGIDAMSNRLRGRADALRQRGADGKQPSQSAPGTQETSQQNGQATDGGAEKRGK